MNLCIAPSKFFDEDEEYQILKNKAEVILPEKAAENSKGIISKPRVVKINGGGFANLISYISKVGSNFLKYESFFSIP